MSNELGQSEADIIALHSKVNNDILIPRSILKKND